MEARKGGQDLGEIEEKDWNGERKWEREGVDGQRKERGGRKAV